MSADMGATAALPRCGTGLCPFPPSCVEPQGAGGAGGAASLTLLEREDSAPRWACRGGWGRPSTAIRCPDSSKCCLGLGRWRQACQPWVLGSKLPNQARSAESGREDVTCPESTARGPSILGILAHLASFPFTVKLTREPKGTVSWRHPDSALLLPEDWCPTWAPHFSDQREHVTEMCPRAQLAPSPHSWGQAAPRETFPSMKTHCRPEPPLQISSCSRKVLDQVSVPTALCPSHGVPLGLKVDTGPRRLCARPACPLLMHWTLHADTGTASPSQPAAREALALPASLQVCLLNTGVVPGETSRESPRRQREQGGCCVKPLRFGVFITKQQGMDAASRGETRCSTKGTLVPTQRAAGSWGGAGAMPSGFCKARTG